MTIPDDADTYAGKESSAYERIIVDQGTAFRGPVA
jgi:hypothetical protein